MNKPAPVPTALDMEVLRQFRVIFKSIRRHFGQIEDMAGISGAQLWALHSIDEWPGLRVTELARAMSVHQSTASNLVEKLVELGYVARTKCVEDSRVVRLTVTPAGRDKLKLAPGPMRGLLPDALAKLPPPVLQDLNRNLEVLLRQMGALGLQDGETPLSDM